MKKTNELRQSELKQNSDPPTSRGSHGVSSKWSVNIVCTGCVEADLLIHQHI